MQSAHELDGQSALGYGPYLPFLLCQPLRIKSTFTVVEYNWEGGIYNIL